MRKVFKLLFCVVVKVKYATIGCSDNWFVFVCLHSVLLHVVLKLGCRKTAHFCQRSRWSQTIEEVHIAERWAMAVVTWKISHCWLAAGITRFPGKQNWSRHLFFILLIFFQKALRPLLKSNSLRLWKSPWTGKWFLKDNCVVGDLKRLFYISRTEKNQVALKSILTVSKQKSLRY